MDKQENGETLLILGHSNINHMDIFISTHPTVSYCKAELSTYNCSIAVQ